MRWTRTLTIAGGTLCLTIPQAVTRSLGWQRGKLLQLDVIEEDETIIIRPMVEGTPVRRLPLEAPPYTPHQARWKPPKKMLN